MKAIVQDTYGSADVLALRDIDEPVPTDHEVLVRVHAAGVDRGVWHVMTGEPYLIRLGFGLRKPKTPVPGMDVSGHVEAVGSPSALTTLSSTLAKWLGGVDRSLRAVILSKFVRQTFRAQFPAEREGDLRVLKNLIEDGKITPVVDKTFPLSEAADAIRYMEAGRARGKILLTV